MKKYRIIYSQVASREIRSISKQYCKSTAQQLVRKIENLTLFMGMGHRIAADKEKILYIGGFNQLVCSEFVVIYKLQGDDIYIYHIAHIKTDYKSLFLEQAVVSSPQKKSNQKSNDWRSTQRMVK